MDANRFFSFTRLGLVMKRDLMENWKVNLYRFLGPYVFFLLMMVSGYLNEESFEEFSKMILGLLGGALFFGGTYAASFVTETMDTQQKRVAYLMLPATSLEKFVARTLYVVLGFGLMVFVALLLAEATRYLFLPLFDLPDSYRQSVLPYVWENVMSVDTFVFEGPGSSESYMINYLGTIMGWLFVGWIHSFYILGGCYWHKHAFWKVLGILLLVCILVIASLLLWVESGMDENQWMLFEAWCKRYFGWVTIIGMLSFLNLLLVALIVLNWWLAYRCFARTQVVKPKFRLL